ncbi:DUF2577 family protein [Tissierella praeacuta]|uniref:DUF2577 family protein n=1 Tax=Tissierella praeacuta TaxID=43131 RepID=UPI00334176DE
MWDVGLAQMFKERDNKSNIGSCVGKVIGINPLKISIMNGEAVLDETIHNIYICDSLIEKEYKIELIAGDYIGDITITSKPSNSLISININDKEKTKLTLYFELKIDDEVLLMPAENEQVFFIVDKVRKVGD